MTDDQKQAVKDANETLDKQFSEYMQEADRRHSRVRLEAIVRRIAAYALKSISVIGAFVIAAGLTEPPNERSVAILIALAALLDNRIFLNHVRLVTAQRATIAFRQIRSSGKNQYNKVRREVTAMAVSNADSQGSANQLINATKEVVDKLNADSEAAWIAFETDDLKALETLALEDSRATSQPQDSRR